MLVARITSDGRLEAERLDVSPEGRLTCPQIPSEMGVEHSVHLNGAVFGVIPQAQPEGSSVWQNDLNTDGTSQPAAETEGSNSKQDWQGWSGNDWKGGKAWQDDDASWWATAGNDNGAK